MISDTIIHVPHSATDIPNEARPTFILSDAELDRELRLMTDWFTDELFANSGPGVETVRFPVSRLVVDPERLLDDELEPMSTVGMGAIYTRTSQGRVLRSPPSAGDRAALLDRFYHSHHRAVGQRVDQALREHGCCLVLDGHSFPSVSLPCHRYQGQATPDICIGTDAFHTPSWLGDAAVTSFQAAGYTVRLNWPFAGTFVPAEHYQRTSMVYALMVEINRRCYLDESRSTKLSGFDQVAATVANTLRSLVDIFRVEKAA